MAGHAKPETTMGYCIGGPGRRQVSSSKYLGLLAQEGNKGIYIRRGSGVFVVRFIDVNNNKFQEGY